MIRFVSQLVVLGFLMESAFSEPLQTQNVILVTADGIRWQELFRGIDRSFVDAEENGELLERYDAGSKLERRERLLPFFWKELAPRGVVYGNRDKGSIVRVTNAFRVSYPGYSEILLGRADRRVTGNDRVYSPEETVLQYVRRTMKLSREQVAVFASWDVFNYLCTSREGEIYINAGYERVPDDLLAPGMEPLNQLQKELLTPWDTVRHDVVTASLALSYLKRFKPRLLYVALGETDDWAHDGRYDRVIEMIRYFDSFLRDLGEVLESMEEYRGKTSLIITVDHGRGKTKMDWADHGEVEGADEIWTVVVGPDTPARGEVTSHPVVEQGSAAATILQLFELDAEGFHADLAAPIPMAVTRK